MRTVKIKIATGVTLAHPGAKLGGTPSGAVIFQVTDVPGDVTLEDVIRKSRCFTGVWRNQYSVQWSALHDA